MKKRYRLPKDHQWKARPGYSCVVLDRGAALFEVPQGWHVSPGQGSIKICDVAPPDDECCLEISLQRHPVDPERIPVKEFLLAALADQDGNSAPLEMRRHNYRLAWSERKFVDPTLNKPARARTALAVCRNLQVLATFAFWEHDLERVAGEWDVFLETLRLGLVIPDPLTGRQIDPSAQ
ncbi:MAG: hypothetical protein AB1758_35150 [Candidatus Eremiobacterota bacterium]